MVKIRPYVSKKMSKNLYHTSVYSQLLYGILGWIVQTKQPYNHYKKNKTLKITPSIDRKNRNTNEPLYHLLQALKILDMKILDLDVRML